MTTNPLTGPPPREVPLPAAPLVRVIAQVRFPMVFSVEKMDFVAPFQEAIRAEYPIVRQEPALIGVGVQGQAAVRAGTIWRFHDRDGAWRVTLAPDFLALECSAYTSRRDFFDRFQRLILPLAEHVRPGLIDRLGVRYINRITGPALDQVDSLIHPSVLGALQSEVGAKARLGVSQYLFDLEEEGGQMHSRWGLLPENMTLDPDALETVAEPSWVLDVDAFIQGQRDFSPAKESASATALAERCYAFFRWAVTTRFLEHFGGEP
jgi:uncharacterized protein (TIGR04255 family)